MTLPKKRRRNIHVDGQEFHWTYNHETKRQGSTAIQLASGAGSIIKVVVVGELKPSNIENAIRFAIVNGWVPDQKSNFALLVNADETPAEILAIPNIANDGHRKQWIAASSLLLSAKRLFRLGVESYDSAQVIAHLANNEILLALDCLIALGKKSTNVDGWRWLRMAADELGWEEKAKQINGFEQQSRRDNDNCG